MKGFPTHLPLKYGKGRNQARWARNIAERDIAQKGSSFKNITILWLKKSHLFIITAY